MTVEVWCSNHYANETHQLMFLTTCYSNFIYVYKYACLVKLKYLQSMKYNNQYQVNWTCTRPYFKSIPQPFAIAVRKIVRDNEIAACRYRHPCMQLRGCSHIASS